MDQSLCVLPAMHSQGLCGLILDHGRQSNDSRGEQFGGNIHDHNWHARLPAHSQRILAFTMGENPQQDLWGVCQTIVKRLDEVVTCHPSITVWNHFAFPQTEEKHWKEEVLSHYLGKVVDDGAHMLGIKLMMQNEEGQYGNAACTLKYEGYMLIYDLQKDVSQWVPVRGISTSLTSLERPAWT